MVCLSRLYPFKFFKSCLPQILLGSFLNTLFQMKKKDHWISSTLSKSFIWFLLKISWTRSIGSIYISKLLAINCWLSNHIDRCWSHVLRVGKKARWWCNLYTGKLPALNNIWRNPSPEFLWFPYLNMQRIRFKVHFKDWDFKLGKATVRPIKPKKRMAD